MLPLGLIESATGWSRAHGDNPPSAVRATTPGARQITGNQPDRFDVTEGAKVFKQSTDSLRYAVPTTIEAKAGGDGLISGYASLFDNEPDRQWDVVARGAFTRSLARHKTDGTVPSMLWAHRQDEVIGRWATVSEDQKGLFVEGRLNLKTQKGREAYEHILAKDANGLSIGFQVPDGGSEYKGDGITLLKTIDLWEVSIVAIPAKLKARITSVKSLGSKAELADLLRDAGMSKTAASRVAAGGWPALAGADHTKAIELAAAIERATAQLRTI